MKVTYTIDSVEILDQTPRYRGYVLFYASGPFYGESRLHSFEKRIKGKRFVDGEYVSDYIQYI